MTASVDARTLLLAHTYEPIKVISWQRAFTLLTLGKVEVITKIFGFVVVTRDQSLYTLGW